MNYAQIYQAIINNASIEQVKCVRKRNNDIYYERHHIIPKCLGGSDEHTNLVLLTAKEHFICHELLCEIYPDNKKLRYAFWRMITGLINETHNNKMQKNYTPSSNVYNRVRQQISKLRKESITPEQIERFRQLGLSNKGTKLTDEHKKHISEGGIGRVQSNETRQKIALKNKENIPWNKGLKTGRPSQDIIDKMKNTKKEREDSYTVSADTVQKRLETRIQNNNLAHTQATKDKISASKKGQCTGRKLSPEVCEKKRQIMMGKNVGKGIGRVVSAETRLKISNSSKGKPSKNAGKPLSEAHKESIRAGMLNRKANVQINKDTSI